MQSLSAPPPRTAFEVPPALPEYRSSAPLSSGQELFPHLMYVTPLGKEAPTNYRGSELVVKHVLELS